MRQPTHLQPKIKAKSPKVQTRHSVCVKYTWQTLTLKEIDAKQMSANVNRAADCTPKTHIIISERWGLGPSQCSSWVAF